MMKQLHIYLSYKETTVTIRSVTLSPLCFSHPLPKAVLLLCKSVQMSLSPLKGEGAVACLSHCDRASSYLRSSVSVPLAQSGNWLNKVVYKNLFKHSQHWHCYPLRSAVGFSFLRNIVCCLAHIYKWQKPAVCFRRSLPSGFHHVYTHTHCMLSWG